MRDSLAALGSRIPPLGSAEASQWFEDWNQSMEAQMHGRLPPVPTSQQVPPVILQHLLSILF